MTMRLILMRHAKSAWDDPILSDKERVLNGRGKRSAIALGKWLRDNNLAPDLALISSAVRTRETWDLLRTSADSLRYLDRLYLAPAGRLENALCNEGADAETILLLAHNPGIGNLANELANAGNTDQKFANYPTGATAVFDLNISDWQDFNSECATLVDFIVPRSLAPEENT